MNRRGLVCLLFVAAQSAWGCRIVCSKGSELWHMNAIDGTSSFQLLKDSEQITEGLECHLPKTSGTEKEQEAQRLVNRCSRVTPEGNTLVFVTEQQLKRTLAFEKSDSSQMEEPVVKTENLLVWRWELHKIAKNGEALPVEVQRAVSFQYADCGSSEER